MTRGPALCYTLLSVPINENEILKSGPKCEQSHRGRRTVGKWSSGEGRCFMASNHAIFIPYHLWWYTIVVFIRTLLGRAPQPPHESNSFSSLLLYAQQCSCILSLHLLASSWCEFGIRLWGGILFLVGFYFTCRFLIIFCCSSSIADADSFDCVVIGRSLRDCIT